MTPQPDQTFMTDYPIIKIGKGMKNKTKARVIRELPNNRLEVQKWKTSPFPHWTGVIVIHKTEVVSDNRANC